MNDIENQWGWSRVEAAADGTLAPAERRRMRAAMAADRSLREAVTRAVRLRAGLRRLRAEPVPPHLWRRLLRIPRGARPGAAWRPRSVALAGLGLAAAAAIAVVALLLQPAPTASVATREAHDRAVADFGVAMAYLRESVTIGSDDSTAAVRGALAAGDRPARSPSSESSNGD